MLGIKGNYIKTSLYMGDMREDVDPKINRVDVMTIQRLNYLISRGRNANGDPHGGVVPTTINFVIRSPKSEQSRKIYRLLRDDDVMKLSFLFNPHYDIDGDLDDYHAATIVTGVVSSSQEEFTSMRSEVRSDSRIMLNVSLMIHSITYVGSSSEHILRFK
ncbi:MAG: hypothetical protein SNG35_00890 [Rikenellaceae bacterium]